ncbi:hypothetical protein, partial [Halomonas sp.]|uniref:hypothetical protein n=1 Tax=Halomonas sp. TaxID=1486246 RepID=UPI003A8F61AB
KRPHELPDQIVKELFRLRLMLPTFDLMTGAACLSEEGVFYAFPGACQPLFSAGEVSDVNLANLLTNRRFSPSFTAGNAWRPRQRMRTLRAQGRLGKAFFEEV